MVALALILAVVVGVLAYLYLQGGTSVEKTAVQPTGLGESRARAQSAGNERPAGAAMEWELTVEDLRARPRMELGHSRGRGYWFEVVGLSQHEKTLRTADSGRLALRKPVEVQCLIVPEPQNPFDKNTVAVYVDGLGKAGRFSRQDAQAYEPLARRLTERGELGACRGELVGLDHGTIAVFLDIKEPERLEGGGRLPTPSPRSPGAVYATGWELRPRVAVGPGKAFSLGLIDVHYFQEAIRKLEADRLARGELATFVALVVPEPERPGRPKSILVCAEDIGPIGRFSRVACDRYSGLATALEGGGRVGLCPGRLIGNGAGLRVRLSVYPAPKALAVVMGL